jgi:hypothetical protein
VLLRFLFNDNKTSEQVVNVQQDEGPKRYIPLTYDDRQVGVGRSSSGPVLMETKIVPAMTDDSPTVEEDLDLSKEDIR